MSTYTVRGLVLRRYPLGEADAIVHLLTEEKGRLELIAKGARRTRSKHLAVTQPFVYGEFLLFPGKSLERLNQGVVLSSYRRLREDLDYFALCTYCSEIADKVLPVAEPALDVFKLLKGLFEYLHQPSQEQINLANALIYFRVSLLKALGYQVDFGSCSRCGNPQALTYFSLSEGGPICSECSGTTPGVNRVQPAVLASLDKISSLGWPKLGIIKLEPYADSIEQLLDSFYGYHLEVQPKSGEFLKFIRR